MSFRKLKTESFQSTMNSGTMRASMCSNVSYILSPMRNVDLKRAAETGDWSELIQKAQANTRRFRRDFYAKKA